MLPGSNLISRRRYLLSPAVSVFSTRVPLTELLLLLPPRCWSFRDCAAPAGQRPCIPHAGGPLHTCCSPRAAASILLPLLNTPRRWPAAPPARCSTPSAAPPISRRLAALPRRSAPTPIQSPHLRVDPSLQSCPLLDLAARPRVDPHARLRLAVRSLPD